MDIEQPLSNEPAGSSDESAKDSASQTETSSLRTGEYFWPLLLIGTWASCLLFWQLGTYTILERVPDEGWYAEVTREMIEQNDYLTLTYLGEVFLEKPPLFYWFQAACMHLFGMNEWAIRLPSALSSLVMILFVYVFTARMVSPKTGLLACVLLTTMLYTLVFGHLGWIDAMLTLSNTMALCFLFGSFENEERSHRLFYAASAAVGFSFLIKGPVGLFFPLAIGGAYLFLTKQLSKFRTLPLLRGVLVFLGIALPWYICMFWVHGWEFYDMYIIEHHLARIDAGDPYVAAEAAPSVGRYFGAIFACILPWTPLVLVALGSTLRRGRALLQKDARLILYLLLWSLIVPLVFAPTKGRYIQYALPASPAWAILTAQFILARSAASTRLWQSKGFAISVFITALALFLLGWRDLLAFPGSSWHTITGCVLLLGGGCALVAFFRKRYLASVISTAVVWSLVSLIFLYGPLAEMQPFRNNPKLARQASEIAGEKGKVLFYRPSKVVLSMRDFVVQPQTLAFYVSTQLHVSYDAEEVVRIMDGPERVCLILSEEDYQEHLAKMEAEVLNAYNVYELPIFAWTSFDFESKGMPVPDSDLTKVIADSPNLKLHPQAVLDSSARSAEKIASPDHRILLLTNGK